MQEIILRATSEQMNWFEAANVPRMSPRHLRRLYARCRKFGYDGAGEPARNEDEDPPWDRTGPL